ncbi:MAG: OmpA family protein [Rhodocyclaceae bacterium]|nr:OmpA family protein [Rhodocyclaceae bacterium]
MKFGTPVICLLAALLAACASTGPTPQAAAEPAPAAQAAPPVEAPPPVPAAPELSGDVRALLAESGAQLADGPEGSVRLTLPGSIAFASGSRKVSEPAQPILDRIAEALLEHPGWRVVIEGHTDSVGRELFNQELSLKRAASVLDYLAGRGLAADKMQADGRGEHAPIADNATAKGRAANRRIEIIVTPAED